jgi:hypothetical protein
LTQARVARRVLGDVRERLADGEVRGGLYRHGESRPGKRYAKLDGYGGVVGEGRQRPLESTVCQDCGMQATGDVAQLGKRVSE